MTSSERSVVLVPINFFKSNKSKLALSQLVEIFRIIRVLLSELRRLENFQGEKP